jgi:signal transduction histidine kinase/CheY-like chemotaxis protein
MFERWFGGLDKTVGRNCFEVFEGRDGICPGCPARVSFETGAVGTLERPFAPDRSRTLALTTSPIRDVDGAVLQVVKMAQDVTERHLLQEERLKTQKLEAIGTLAGGIAHDFNNLLQGVFGFISLAKTLSDPRAPVQEALQDAEKALALAVRLTGQLLTFSKGGKPVRRPMALQPVIENATRFALSGSRSDFHLAVEEGLWGAEADEGQVSQVIQNVVLNADQAMPEAGHVRIAARNREAPGSDVPGDLPPGRYVEIAVSDTGIGIPSAHLGKIFDPYFTTRQGGSGLGLATSYSIVKNHGGAIDVRSEQGRGTTFRIFLPATAAPLPEPDRAAPTAPRAARSARILVMDDEPVVLNVARKLLKALGHEVECVTNGAEALERYEGARVGGRPFDVAMLDLTIRGGMGGAETLQRLLAADPHVTAIVSSGYSDDSSIASYQAQGFKAVLNKPYTLDALREVLHRVLDA